MKRKTFQSLSGPTVLTAISILLTQSTNVRAGATGADLLLQGTKTPNVTLPPVGVNSSNQSDHLSPDWKEFKLDNPFLVQIFSDWQAHRSALAPEVNQWVSLNLKKDFEAASHLWSGVEKQVLPGFLLDAQLIHLHGLLQLGLIQTTVESWVEFLTSKATSWSSGRVPTIVSAFEQSWKPVLGQSLDQFLREHAWSLPAEWETAVLKVDPQLLPSVSTIQAAALVRRGEQGLALLALLPANHAYKLPLAQTVALAQAKKGDLGAAALTLKVHAEKA